MLGDPGYDAWVRGADDPAARFADEALRSHRRTNRAVDAAGRLQLPWPRRLGTAPWSLARELPGDHDVRLVIDRDAAWERLATTTAPAPFYVGNRWLPRHVVLAIGATGSDRLTVYEPSAGVDLTVERSPFVGARLGLAGWDRPWVTVVPAG